MESSPIDYEAIKHWKGYSMAHNEMLARSHNPMAPWTLVRADDKRLARLNIIKDLLGRLHYPDKDERLIGPDPANRIRIRYLTMALNPAKTSSSIQATACLPARVSVPGSVS
jgi:Polyphosphate kinase 2 (PPK2)